LLIYSIELLWVVIPASVFDVDYSDPPSGQDAIFEDKRQSTVVHHQLPASAGIPENPPADERETAKDAGLRPQVTNDGVGNFGIDPQLKILEFRSDSERPV
jgi:hypothetical protein